MKKTILFIATTLGLHAVQAQKISIDPDAMSEEVVSHVMYQKTIIRALDLREKQNLPLFARNREFTALLLEGVEKGSISPYENDSLQTKLTIEKFYEKLLTPNAANFPIDTIEAALEYGDEWKKIQQAIQHERYSPRDLYQLEIKETILFDKQRSQMRYDIQAITLYIPADHPMNATGIQLPVASFHYKELVQNLFKENPKACWVNVQNDREHKNLADAFELRLFSSYLVKVSNPGDDYLSDIYQDPQKGIMASTWAAHELMEYEHNLWEF